MDILIRLIVAAVVGVIAYLLVKALLAVVGLATSLVVTLLGLVILALCVLYVVRGDLNLK